MSAGDKPFGGSIGKTVKESRPWWPDETRPPRGAPNILVILFDDVGFSDFATVLQVGKSVLSGTAAALAQDPQVQHAYLGGA